MSKKGRVMNSRISATEDTRDRLRDFANGLGATYEGALIFLMDKLIGDKNPLYGGSDYRDEFNRKYPDAKDKGMKL